MSAPEVARLAKLLQFQQRRADEAAAEVRRLQSENERLRARVVELASELTQARKVYEYTLSGTTK